MNSIASQIDAVIASDSSWLGVEWLRGSKHFSASFDHVASFPDHAAHWRLSGPLAKCWEEWSLCMLCVMLFKHGLARLAEFHGDQLETFGLEPGNDLTDEASLNSVRLDHNISPLSLNWRWWHTETNLHWLVSSDVHDLLIAWTCWLENDLRSWVLDTLSRDECGLCNIKIQEDCIRTVSNECCMLTNLAFPLEFLFKFCKSKCESRINKHLWSKCKLHAIVILFILSPVDLYSGKLQHLVTPVEEVPLCLSGAV